MGSILVDCVFEQYETIKTGSGDVGFGKKFGARREPISYFHH